MFELAEGAAVEERRADDVVAHLRQIGQGEVLRRHARRGRHGIGSPLECGHAPLEDLGGGVAQAGVDVALLLQRKAGCSLRCAVEDVGGGLVDGQGAGSRRRVGPLAGVHLQGFESVVLLGHGVSFLCLQKNIRPFRGRMLSFIWICEQPTPGTVGGTCTSSASSSSAFGVRCRS